MIHKRYPVDEERLLVDPTYEPYFEEGYLELLPVGNIEIDGVGKCEVFFCTNEDANTNNIPHFHIVSEDEETFETCISMYTNEYYDHDGLCNKTLSEADKVRLNDLMKKQFKPQKCTTEWEFWTLIRELNAETEYEIAHPIDPKQPDYTTMNQFMKYKKEN